jgi:putative transposase
MRYKPRKPPHIYQDELHYFLTATTFDRNRIFRGRSAKELLQRQLMESVARYRIRLRAWVLLDDHYHLLFRVPRPQVLQRFVKHFHARSAVAVNSAHNKAGRRVWHNHWDYCPRNEESLYRVFNYIHANPLKHGYVKVCNGAFDALRAYPFSSFRYYAETWGEERLASIWFHYPPPHDCAGD